MDKLSAGVLGASSFAGECLLPLLVNAGLEVQVFSRQANKEYQTGNSSNIAYRQLDQAAIQNLPSSENGKKILYWICLMPIWALPNYFPLMLASGAKRIVALSSTSIFTKPNSPDLAERDVAAKLKEGEQRLVEWAEANQIEWIILRPTMIYGLGRDRNICEIARFILRFGFFPLLGSAQGLRQPVHVEDVAFACFTALQSKRASNHAYNLSGGEKLAYRNMVERIFQAMGKPVRFIRIPIWTFRLAIACFRVLPRYRYWSAAMVERMNVDMSFDYLEAARDFGFAPRLFSPDEKDLGS